MTKVTYTVEAFATATAALFTPANAIDKALAGAESAKTAWAQMAANGITAGTLDMDGVRDALISAAAAYVTRTKGKKAGAAITSMKAIPSQTVRGWFYDLKRAADNGLLPLLLEGHSLTGLRRATEASQKQAPKGGKGKTAAKADDAPKATPLPVIAPTSLEDLATQLETDAKRMSIKTAHANAMAIARIVAAASKLAAMAEKGALAAKPKAKAKAKAKAKPAAPKVADGAVSVLPRRKAKAAAVAVKAIAA